MYKRSKRAFVDSEKIDEDMFCSICLEVFEDPHTLSCKYLLIQFSHTFCYSCIVYGRSIKKQCPLCRNVDTVFKPLKDVYLSSYINYLISKCCHAGCKWIGRYKNLKNHQRLCQQRPLKVQKNIDCQIINAYEKKCVIEIDNDHIMGKKQINIGRTDNPQVSRNLVPFQLPRNSLLHPPILLVANYRPVNGRFFDNQTNVVPVSSSLHNNKSNQVIDLENNADKSTQNRSKNRLQFTTKNRTSKDSN